MVTILPIIMNDKLNKTESLCISPYSITAAFLMLMIGASGRSKQQLSTAIFKNSLLSDEENLKYYKSMHTNIVERAGINVVLFKGGHFDMVFILPDETDGLPNIEEKITSDFLNDISRGFKNSVYNIAIPKFKLDSECDLTKELPKLGVKDIFGFKANFSDLIIERSQGLHIKVAVHKGCFQHERSRMRTVPWFTADRPFLFYVRDIKSGLILFIGRFYQKVK
ncbi:intracellular coagulation inhibitor 3-like [Mytilus trossulus]|uniref:intracellular coagulation inhibitor 3-like n=1 Tax=Mytilus trossulus TaxID=6551 RepID=UPI003007D3EA